MRRFIWSGLLGVALVAGAGARAAEPVRIVLKDNKFTPNEVRVPAGARFQIELDNQGSAAAEFESSELRFEKVVAPGSKITVTAGPLKPGSYKFVNEYNQETTGTVIAVEGLAVK